MPHRMIGLTASACFILHTDFKLVYTIWLQIYPQKQSFIGDTTFNIPTEHLTCELFLYYGIIY